MLSEGNQKSHTTRRYIIQALILKLIIYLCYYVLQYNDLSSMKTFTNFISSNGGSRHKENKDTI